MAFTHLHLHTEYSLLDGACRIKDVVAKAKACGMDSLAITDHGVMFGVIDFYKECRKQGIQPILGCELYLAARSMYDKDTHIDRQRAHLVLLAENDTGFHNLIKLVSESYTKGFYYKPRVDKELLKKYSEGIIALSACLAGTVSGKLLDRDYEGARREALEMREIFGENNYFLELQNQGLKEEALINPEIIRISQETGIPLICTNDVHYINREDAEAHDILLAIQTQNKVDDEGRMRFPNDQFYLKTEEEMRELFSNIPEAVENTHRIAMRCDVNIEFGRYHLPRFTPPEGMTNSKYLRFLCEEGIKKRYEPVTEDLHKRLEKELSVIESMGYVEYFLIVWDFIRYARENGIMVGPGRGSAAGSLVSYCLRITDIDPIKYNLIFERFLNPERVSMPDIDIDFCIERRGEVIDYVKKKYGDSNVSQIITFGTMKAKAAIRDVARVLNVDYGKTDMIAKAVPAELNITLEKAMDTSPDLRKMYETDETVRKVIDMAKKLEGMLRHASTHAAGIVISKLPIDEYVPLYKSDKVIATQFDMVTIEELGLLKMDFLGLRNLTVIRDAIAMIEKNHCVSIDFSNMDYDDPKIYDMIAAGNTEGVFQLESAGMTDFMKRLKPTCFEDIVAGISLFRPGPMESIPKYIENKKDPSRINYSTPQLAPILDVTYGCLVYQEQVMQIVRQLAGYSYGRSDIVRRAMSKKKRDVMLEEKKYFIDGKVNDAGDIEIAGCVRNGISREAAENIFADMETFAQYAFNKSHAAAYAVLAYETGYLKRHYPREFMAALISSVMGDSKQVAKYIRSCVEMGIEVLPPDVNESEFKFKVEDGKIRFGLGAVKNIGENAIENIVESRNQKGKYKDIFSFIENIDVTVVNKKAVESLIKAGALDSINPNRAAGIAAYEGLMDLAHKDAKRNVDGQISLFSAASNVMDENMSQKLPNVAPFSNSRRMSLEKEVLGVYVSGHPLDDYAEMIKKLVTVTTKDLSVNTGEDEDGFREEGLEITDVVSDYDGTRATVAGAITSIRTILDKRNEMMAFITIEDLYDVFEVTVFSKTFERSREFIKEDRVVLISGKLEIKDGGKPKIIADSISELKPDAENIDLDITDNNEHDESSEDEIAVVNEASELKTENRDISDSELVKKSGLLKIRLGDGADQNESMKRIEEIFKEHIGNSEALLYLPSGEILSTRGGKGVNISYDLMAELNSIFGKDNVKVSER